MLRDAIRRLIRAWPDHSLVLAICAASFLACVATGTGYHFGTVLDRYAHFFAFYFMILFLLTRISNQVAATMPRGGRVMGRIASLLGGGATDTEVRRLDFEFVRGSLIFFAAIVTYSNVKMRIPIINPVVGDMVFAEMDRILFRTDFVWLADWLRQSPNADAFLQRVYLHDYVFMAIFALLLYLRRRPRDIRILFTAASITYLLGVWVTVAWPSYGPWFVDQTDWGWLREHPMGRYQAGLAAGFQMSMKAKLAGAPLPTRAFMGIAAFPSLHVGHMVLLLFLAASCEGLRWYAVLMGIVALLTFAATMAYGWHYAVDAPGGAAVAYAGFRLARRLCPPEPT